MTRLAEVLLLEYDDYTILFRFQYSVRGWKGVDYTVQTPHFFGTAGPYKNLMVAMQNATRTASKWNEAENMLNGGD